MKQITLNINFTKKFINIQEIKQLESEIKNIITNLSSKTKDFTGWIDLPSTIESQLEDIEKTSQELRKKIDTLVVIGIGGSYLGARAIFEAIKPYFSNNLNNMPEIIWAGHNLCESYLSQLLEYLNNKNYGIVVISKSGTTTEPAIAFRLIKNHLEKKVSREILKELIIVITDKEKGALRKIANEEGYKSYIIPDDVGGRFSVLTPVGLVPLAIAGINIRNLINGAKEFQSKLLDTSNISENISAIYAALRFLLYKSGKKIEVLASFENNLHYIAEWWKQLYGESEGKELKGLFPTSVDYTTDLHSLGQYMQEGERHIFETIITVEKSENKLLIPYQNDDTDELNYIAGKSVNEINKMAEKGTILAHYEGNVPIIIINLPMISEYYLGQLLYFFELACAISGYLIKVNPFNQPGVEAYKKNMFALLNKPGYENFSQEIKNKLQNI